MLLIDFGVVSVQDDKSYGCWSGLIFNVTTPMAAKKGLSRCVVAQGGRFDNLCAHYTLEVDRKIPQAVVCSFRVAEIA